MHLHPQNQALLRQSLDDEEEADDPYRFRLRELLPNFPVQIIDDWIIRHGPSAFSEHGWLVYRRFHFEAAERGTAFLRHEVMTSNEMAVDDWSKAIRTHPQFQKWGVGAYMLENGTWPVPPVILDNRSGLVNPRGEPLGRFHLLEGHHRLAYLKGFATPPAIRAKSSHAVWLVTYE